MSDINEIIEKVNKEIIIKLKLQYENMINTKAGKEFFWNKIYYEENKVDLNVEIIKLINALYQNIKG